MSKLGKMRRADSWYCVSFLLRCCCQVSTVLVVAIVVLDALAAGILDRCCHDFVS